KKRRQSSLIRQKGAALGYRGSRTAVSAVARRAHGLAAQGRSLVRRRAGRSRRPVSGDFAASLAVAAQLSERFQADDLAVSGRAEYCPGLETAREKTSRLAKFASHCGSLRADDHVRGRGAKWPSRESTVC